MNLVFFILISLSITNILGREHIFLGIRSWIIRVFPRSLLRKLITCLTCLGFWIGILVSLTFPEYDIKWYEGALISSIANKVIEMIFYKF